MELFKVNNLLEKYYEGQSSKHEEAQLRSFFKGYQGNDTNLLEAKMLFSVFTEASEENVAIDFETIAGKKPAGMVQKVYFRMSALAAAVVIGFAVVFMLTSPQKQVVYAYVNGQPITNKQEALAYSMQAMNELSTNLNKGTEHLNQMGKLNMPAMLLTVKK
jgi:hypothetical protein